MKRFFALIIAVIVVLCIGIAAYRYTRSKYSDMNYTVERYVSSGIFNKHKLYKINDMNLSFSDSNIAVMKVEGLQEKPPHNHVTYKIFLEKNKAGLWKVVKLYTE
jgi:uncharacterized protein YxeA